MFKSLKVFVLGCLPTIGLTQNVSLSDTLELKTVTVSATLATEKMPITRTDIYAPALRRNDFGQDVPYLLRTTPSVVETSDAGTGIGYTGLRIRGTDASRINVTIDGIPLNDAESQNVYWVDLPDFGSSVDQIQIQRGVGTSTNGAGAFGATVNLTTHKALKTKELRYEGSYGSFNTRKHALHYQSNFFNNKLFINARLSKINSDGYLQRATADLNSWYLAGTYLLSDHSTLSMKAFGGHEVTYQAWSGVPAQYINIDSLRRYNIEGTEKAGEPYKNQVDDYQQKHFHLTWAQSQPIDNQSDIISKQSLSLHYTHGSGFYEQYKANQKLAPYGWNFVLRGADTFFYSDLVRRLWLDNHFGGLIYSYYYKDEKMDLTMGVSGSFYSGDHFGEVIQIVEKPTEKMGQYYQNFGFKTDYSVFAKTNYNFNEQLSGFLDMQYRKVEHEMRGIEKNQRLFEEKVSYIFLNPKIGLYYARDKSKIYASFAVANREPSRDDIVEARKNELPKPEQLLNTEIGYKYLISNGFVSANYYNMFYNNQLVLTGQINDVGNPIRVNVPKSYRNGIELQANWKPIKPLSIGANASFSIHKTLNFTEYRDNWDTWGQDTIAHGTTNLAFSPSAVANVVLGYELFKKDRNELSFVLQHKYVGKQYVDNTNNENTTLAAYQQTDLKIFYNTHFYKVKNLTLKLLINNLLNQQFSSNAWAYRFTSANYDPRPADATARAEGNNTYHLMGYFPQAGINFLFGLSVAF
jgi:iron complex outermembrane recepter protein